ncbi:MAG: hypothetical protein ACHQWU_12690, partial [Gemmatimonadales bacterium]
MTKQRLVVVLTMAVGFPALAQAQKKALTQADWDIWKSINAPALSNDGKWAVYTLVPQVGDGELVVRATSGGTEFHVARGFLGRPNNTPGGLRGPAGGTGEADPTGPTTSPAQITADSRFVLASVEPSQAEVERVPRARANALIARTSLAIVSLPDGKVTTIPNVRSFRLPRANGAWVAYVPGADTTAGDSSTRGGAGAAPAGRGGRGRGGPAGGRRQFGAPLVLRNLATGAEERLSDVLAFSFDDSAKVFAYTVVARDSSKDGAFLRDLRSGATATLLAGAGDYKSLELDHAGSQIVFLADRDEFGRAPRPRYTLYEASVRGGGAQAIVTPTQVTPGMHLADNAPIAFTRTGTAITFSVAPPSIDSVPADSLVGKAVFDLWHYKDPVLQPTQRINAVRDRNKSYEAIYLTGTKKVVQLADDSLPQVNVSDDGRVAVANSRERYMIESMWGDGGTDVWLIDPSTNARKLIKEKINGNAQLSPDAKFATFYDHGHWYSYNVATSKLVDLTGSLKNVHFDEETDDHPAPPPAWGLAGWTKGDKSVLLYDHFDVWDRVPMGVKAPIVLTDSAGRRGNIQFRLAEGAGGRG